jgi:microcystin-dependent protein
MSTYSTSLRAELITNGAQAGTWGDTTNNNFAYVFDAAIAGYQAVSITSTAQALTYVNGPTSTIALNQSIYQSLKLTAGGVGAAFSIYAPPVAKTYVIYNATSYAATIYNSTVIGNTTAGGTGVTIPAGETMTVVTDGGTSASGAGFTQQNTAFISPHLSGTPTAPTATSGDNSTQIATTAFVQVNGTPTGGLMLWPTASPPANWLICNGAAVSRTTYATLFAVVGTVFGAGNGSTTFNLPNYTDRMPIGAGSSYAVNAQGGTASTTLTTTELPSHSHSASSSSSSSSSFSGSAGTTGTTNIDHNHNESWAAPDFGGPITAARLNANGVQPVTGGMNSNQNHNHTFTPSGTVSTSTSTSTTIGSTGSGAAFTNLPPYLGIYFIIKT